MINLEHELRANRNASFNCSHCLSGCSAINYDATFSLAKIHDDVKELRENNLTPVNVAMVYMYYARSNYRSEKKDELVGFTDFLCKLSSPKF